MNDKLAKELEHFVSTAERMVSDIASQVELAKYLIAESKKGEERANWLPSFPAYMPSGILEIQSSIAVINYLQTEDSMSKIRASNASHPMPKRN